MFWKPHFTLLRLSQFYIAAVGNLWKRVLGRVVKNPTKLKVPVRAPFFVSLDLCPFFFCPRIGVNPCSSVQCKLNEECVINKYGIAACECISDCEPIVRPVCGSDGLTYDSNCHLQQSSCQLKTAVTVAYNGVCGEYLSSYHTVQQQGS